MGSNMLSNAASSCHRTHDSSEMSFVPCPRVEHVLFSIRVTRLSTTHNHIGQLVSEPHQDHKVICSTRSTIVEGHHSRHKQVSSIMQQFQEDHLLLVAFDTKRHDSHCGCKVFYMCNSFVAKKRGSTQPKTHKDVSFFSVQDRYRQKQVSCPNVNWHTLLKMTFEQFGLEPWGKFIDKPSPNGKTKCRACETTTRASGLTCHNQKGKYRQMVKCSRPWQIGVIFLAMHDLAEKVHVKDLIANRNATAKSYPCAFDLTVVFFWVFCFLASSLASKFAIDLPR